MTVTSHNNFSVTLWITDRSEGMVEANVSDKLFKVLGDELAAAVGNDSWFLAVESIQGSLYDQLNILFYYGCYQFMMDHITGILVYDCSQEHESTHDIDIGYIDMPFFVGTIRLHISHSLFT